MAHPSRPSRAFVFDLYGTLLDVGSVTEACRAVVPAGQSSDPAALVELWRAKQLEYSWLRALMDRYVDFEAVTGDALDYAAARLGLRLDPGARAGLLEAYRRLSPFPEAVEVLDRLAPRPRAVLSNGSPAMLRASLAGSGLEGRLDPVLSVDAVRTYKPSPAVYRVACDALGLPAEAITFVSANAWDAAGAAAFGFRTVWVNRRGLPFDRLGVSPHVEARDLTALLAES